MNMKNIITKVAAVALLSFCFVACSEEEPSGVDTQSLRLSLTPVPEVISATGGSFESIVVVHQGYTLDVEWDATVDFEPDWVSMSKIQLTGTFEGTYEGDDVSYVHDGIKVTVSPNQSGKHRSAALRFTVSDGSSIIYIITQSK